MIFMLNIRKFSYNKNIDSPVFYSFPPVKTKQLHTTKKTLFFKQLKVNLGIDSLLVKLYSFIRSDNFLEYSSVNIFIFKFVKGRSAHAPISAKEQTKNVNLPRLQNLVLNSLKIYHKRDLAQQIHLCIDAL